MTEYLVDLDTGCWVWQRARTTAGYGTLTVDGKTQYAHRVYYEGYVADIPQGFDLDHLCRNYVRGHAGSWREDGGYALDPSTGCWVWRRSTSLNGYGQVWHEGRLQRAHRVFNQLHVGPIPDGLQIDHTCENKLCVNPDHLEAVTSLENTHRNLRKRHEN